MIVAGQTEGPRSAFTCTISEGPFDFCFVTFSVTFFRSFTQTVLNKKAKFVPKIGPLQPPKHFPLQLSKISAL